VDGNPLTITVTGLPAVGTVTLADGTPVTNGQVLTGAQLAGLQFDAPADLLSPTSTSFTYSVNDGTVTVNAGTTISLTPVNDAPVAQSGSFSVAEDATVVTGSVIATDADVGATLNFTLNGVAPAGLTFNSNGTYSFNPANAAYQSLAQGQSTTITVPYTVTDNVGATSTANLVITVTGTNDAPVAQAASFTVAEDAAVVNGSVTATDADTGATLTYTLNGAAPAGLTFNPNGSYSFNPGNSAYQSLAQGQSALITVPYTVTDNNGATSTANLLITVTGTNDAPVANANSVAATEDNALTLAPATLLANDTDVDSGTTLTITSVQSPVNGTVALVGGNVVFTPTANYSGPASFTYTASDGQGGTSTATVTVNIAPVADAPTLVAPTQLISVVPGTASLSTTAATSQAALEGALGLPAGQLDTFSPPTGPGTNDPGAVNVIDGQLSNYTLTLGSGNTASFNWQFFNGEDTVSEINNGFNDLVVLVITDPNGNKQYVQLTSSEQTGRNTNGTAVDATGTYTFTATGAGEYQFSWMVLNGGDDGKDSSLTVSAPTVTVGGTAYGQPIDLPIVNGLVDRDGSETLSAVTISGVPAGAALSAGTNLGGGNWSLTAAQLADLKILPASGFTGSFNLTLSSTATESNGSTATSTQTVAVTVSSTTANQNGTQGADTLTGTAGNDSLQGFDGNDTINAGDGNDLVYGGAGTDTINGGNGGDLIYGGAGNDTIDGGAGADRIYGGAGSDSLTGGAGADVFAWTLADRGTTASPAVDTIADFNTAAPSAGGDVLDLRDLLSGEHGAGAGNLSNFIHFSTDGTSTTIQISTTGAFSGSNYGTATDQTIVLQNVNLFTGGLTTDQQILQDLLTKAKLVVDG
ncbi:MAG: tandem-95 repeat protein, partial [Burkholderiaceae bacterium]